MTMMLIASIKKSLLLGTSRAGAQAQTDLPAALQDTVFADAQNQTGSPESALWERIAALDLWTRAGTQALAFTTNHAEIAADENLKPCPQQAETKLFLLLQGTYPELRFEWLTLARQHACHLPYKFLPAMLDLARTQVVFRPYVVEVMGARGKWLASQNPAWNWHADACQAEDGLWQTGTLEQRLEMLRLSRSKDPELGRTMLQEVWSTEPPEHRIRLIQCLKENLSLADQEFLELALDDKRKEVRATAQALLLTMPDSLLEQRMRARLDNLLSIRPDIIGDTELIVSLPLERDKAMQRDGIGSTTYHGVGEKAGWLLDMLAAVSPLYWSEKWQLSPVQLFALAAKTDYQQVLLTGWATALQALSARPEMQSNLLPQFENWCVELSRLSMQTDSKHRANLSPYVYKIWANVPPTFVNDFFMELLAPSQTSSKFSVWTILELFQQVAAQKQQWPAPLSIAIVAHIRHNLSQLTAEFWSLKQVLNTIALVIDPAQVHEYERDWPRADANWDKWQATIDDFLALLRFRSEMMHTFLEQQ